MAGIITRVDFVWEGKKSMDLLRKILLRLSVLFVLVTSQSAYAENTNDVVDSVIVLLQDQYPEGNIVLEQNNSNEDVLEMSVITEAGESSFEKYKLEVNLTTCIVTEYSLLDDAYRKYNLEGLTGQKENTEKKHLIEEQSKTLTEEETLLREIVVIDDVYQFDDYVTKRYHCSLGNAVHRDSANEADQYSLVSWTHIGEGDWAAAFWYNTNYDWCIKVYAHEEEIGLIGAPEVMVSGYGKNVICKRYSNSYMINSNGLLQLTKIMDILEKTPNNGQCPLEETGIVHICDKPVAKIQEKVLTGIWINDEEERYLRFIDEIPSIIPLSDGYNSTVQGKYVFFQVSYFQNYNYSHRHGTYHLSEEAPGKVWLRQDYAEDYNLLDENTLQFENKVYRRVNPELYYDIIGTWKSNSGEVYEFTTTDRFKHHDNGLIEGFYLLWDESKILTINDYTGTALWGHYRLEGDSFYLGPDIFTRETAKIKENTATKESLISTIHGRWICDDSYNYGYEPGQHYTEFEFLYDGRYAKHSLFYENGGMVTRNCEEMGEITDLRADSVETEIYRGGIYHKFYLPFIGTELSYIVDTYNQDVNGEYLMYFRENTPDVNELGLVSSEGNAEYEVVVEEDIVDAGEGEEKTIDKSAEISATEKEDCWITDEKIDEFETKENPISSELDVKEKISKMSSCLFAVVYACYGQQELRPSIYSDQFWEILAYFIGFESEAEAGIRYDVSYDTGRYMTKEDIIQKAAYALFPDFDGALPNPDGVMAIYDDYSGYYGFVAGNFGDVHYNIIGYNFTDDNSVEVIVEEYTPYYDEKTDCSIFSVYLSAAPETEYGYRVQYVVQQ